MTFVTAFRVAPRIVPAGERAGTLDLILALVRTRARRLVALMEQAWAAGRTSPDQGLAIGPGEVERLLAGEAEALEDEACAAANPWLAGLANEAGEAQAVLARDPAWSRLCRVFALGEDEADFLALLLAVAADPGLARVVAYLHDDTRRDAPSPLLAARLADRPCRVWRAPALLRWSLAGPVETGEEHSLSAGWRVDPAVVAALEDGAWHDPAIGEATRLAQPDETSTALPLQPDALRALEAIDDLGGTELVGPVGIGRETLAAQYAAAHGRPLLTIDLALLDLEGPALRKSVVSALRYAAFAGAIAYFRGADDVPAAEWTRARRLGVDFLRGVRVPACGEVAIGLAPLPLADREALWRSLTSAQCPAALVSQRLTPAEILRLARRPGSPRRTRLPDHKLLVRLECHYGWDDLVLPRDIARQLRELADQVRHRWQVHDGWGYATLTHLGNGIAALFGGPSGTGKTMAAQVIARELGLELFRVDLAGVVNKYVGETEKKLREVFDACEDSGALLFFDEADALFGGRMQVKDAHDRFANIETNYLLQRIETFDGVAILATNRRDEIDEAFVRRLRFIVDFLPPQAEERMVLWRRALRESSPTDEPLLGDIDWPLLAERLAMTGAAIKNTALAAAFLAHGEGKRIGMEHVLHAAARELAKNYEKLPIALRRGASDA